MCSTQPKLLALPSNIILCPSNFTSLLQITKVNGFIAQATILKSMKLTNALGYLLVMSEKSFTV
jgi:hypothetical protein